MILLFIIIIVISIIINITISLHIHGELNLSKSNQTEKSLNFLSMDDSIVIFLSYGALVVHIRSGMAAQHSVL